MKNIKVLFANCKGRYRWWKSFLERYDTEKRLSFYTDSSQSGPHCKNADILISGCFGSPEERNQVLKENPKARKIYWSMEHSNGTNLNRVVNSHPYFVNIKEQLPWDTSFTFEVDAPEYNNIRFPFWIYYAMASGAQGNHGGDFDPDYRRNLAILNKKSQPEDFNTRKFCTIVASKMCWQSDFRVDVYKKINKYKQVDFRGNALARAQKKPDDGSWVKDKIQHQSQFKFAMAFENASHLGYTTEKILDAYRSGCIPIYWGNPAVVTDFNSDTFINAHEF